MDKKNCKNIKRRNKEREKRSVKKKLYVLKSWCGFFFFGHLSADVATSATKI